MSEVLFAAAHSAAIRVSPKLVARTKVGLIMTNNTVIEKLLQILNDTNIAAQALAKLSISVDFHDEIKSDIAEQLIRKSARSVITTENVPGYLYAFTYLVGKNWQKQRWKYYSRFEPMPQDFGCDSIDDGMEIDDQKQLLQSVLADLSELDRELFRLLWLGQSTRECCDALAINARTFAKRKSRLLEKLRGLI